LDVDNMVEVLSFFLFISKLNPNWKKNLASHFGVNRFKPTWLIKYVQVEIKEARDGEFSKLLKTTFGLNLDVNDVDAFSVEKTRKNSIIGTPSTYH
jgi:hypothetical protein